MSEDRYARVYFDRIARDPKFDGIRNDRGKIGSWLLCLVEAEKAWPAPAFPLPLSWVPARDFADLVAHQIIDVDTDGRFRLHGLDAERAARSRRATDAANSRWSNAASNAGSNAAGIADSSAGSSANGNASRARAPRLVSSSSSSPSGGGPGEGLPNLNSAVVKVWEDATGLTILASGDFALRYLDDACRRHPASEVAAAVIRARRTFDHIPAPQPLVVAIRSLLDPMPNGKRVAEVERTADEERAAQRRRDASQVQLHDLNGHVDSPRPTCPKCQKGATA